VICQRVDSGLSCRLRRLTHTHSSHTAGHTNTFVIRDGLSGHPGISASPSIRGKQVSQSVSPPRHHPLQCSHSSTAPHHQVGTSDTTRERESPRDLPCSLLCVCGTIPDSQASCQRECWPAVGPMRQKQAGHHTQQRKRNVHAGKPGVGRKTSYNSVRPSLPRHRFSSRSSRRRQTALLTPGRTILRPHPQCH